MLDEAPPIRRAEWQRPDPMRVALLAGVPTGHVVDALGGSGALHARIKPAVPEQAAFTGVALTCDNGPADNLAL